MAKFNVALVLSLSKMFDRRVVEGISRFVHENNGWSLFLENDPDTKIPDFRHSGFHGVLADLDDRRIPRQISKIGIPVVGIGAIKPDNPFNLVVPTVGTNNHQIGAMAAEYLMRHQFENFAYCGLTLRTIDPWNEIRQAGFVNSLAEHGYKCSVFKTRHSASSNWKQLQEDLGAWLATLPRPVGVLAANDLRARHLLEACRRCDLSVPGDVAVLGVDNDELICELASPPLSSIMHGAEKIGYSAATLLDSLMKDGAEGKVQSVLVPPVAVVERVSTDLVATDDQVVAGALRIIRQQACEGIGADQVAEQLMVSRSTLEQSFKRVTGRTVHDEILRTQLNVAKSLLATTELSLEEVARRCGFCHAQYLAAVFRRMCGRTPGSFRRHSLSKTHLSC